MEVILARRVPTIKTGWLSGSMAVRAFLDAQERELVYSIDGKRLQDVIEALRIRKIDYFTELGVQQGLSPELSRQEAEKTVQEEWVGTYKNGSNDVLCASDKAMTELVRDGYIERITKAERLARNKFAPKGPRTSHVEAIEQDKRKGRYFHPG